MTGVICGYPCIPDSTKLIVCKVLHRDLAEIVFNNLQDELTRDVRKAKKAVLDELVQNDQVVYLKLTHEMFDRYKDNNGISIDNSITDDMDIDSVISYMNLVTRIKSYYQDDSAEARWHIYKCMFLNNKVKKAYIDVMRFILAK